MVKFDDYYYGGEADQYTFYRIPKALFTNDRYKVLSDGAKILYGLMLDRMGLSIKNNWLDEQDRVYIYFTLEDVQEYMNCQRDKGMKLLAELDTDKGVGLIERVKQGLGKPAIIYVKKFLTVTDLQGSVFPTSGLHDLPTSVSRNKRPLDYGKTDPNNIKSNNTELNDTENIIPSCRTEPPVAADVTDRIEQHTAEVREQIGYDDFALAHPQDMRLLDEIVAIIVDAVLTNSESVRIDGEIKPRKLLRHQLRQLDYETVEHVVAQFKGHTGRIRKKRQFILTMLYNASMEIDAHRANENCESSLKLDADSDDTEMERMFREGDI